MSENGNFDALQALEVYREPIRANLAHRYEQYLADSRGTPGDVVYQDDTIMQSLVLSMGKGLRGALTNVTYKSFGGLDPQVGLMAGAALEENHLSLLAFDDFMDEAKFRHGIETPHVQWESYIRNYREISEDRKAEITHMANSLAVNTANELTYKALQTLTNIQGVPAERIVRAINIHSQNMVRTGQGQARDVINALNGLSNEDEIVQTYIDKTAYTFVNTMQVGACLAGASDNDLDGLRRVGEEMSIVYQVKDDLLGMLGDPEETGKPVFDDLRQGTMTLLLHYVLEHAMEEDKLIITALRGKPIEDHQHDIVRRILQRPGKDDAISAERYVEEMAQAHIAKAHDILAEYPDWDEGFQEFLRVLLTFLFLRKS